MKDGQKDRLWELCEQAANEPDPNKLMMLVAEISKLLDKKEPRSQSTDGSKETLTGS